MVKGIVIGFLLAVVILAGAVFGYFASGMAPVATADPPMPFEKKLANMALDAHIEKQHVVQSPVAADEPAFLAGAGVYKEHCAVCHGLPDQPKTFIAQGMFPSPPQLFHGVGVSDDPATETYWKVENGIRLTGMPGFKGRLTETQVWQVSVLLANSDKIPDSVKAALVAKSPAPEAVPTMSTTTPPKKP